MGTVFSYPGVYLEEIPNQPHPIPGLSQPVLMNRLLSPQNSGALRKLGTRVTRGCSGVGLLLTGPNPIARFRAVSALARELRHKVYRIDLAEVVSKYIGETEKNLRRIFAAAEHGRTLLFFDEADALFGKRTEVKDAHDRYANLEAAFLLQRLEKFRGLAILATNHRVRSTRRHIIGIPPETTASATETASVR